MPLTDQTVVVLGATGVVGSGIVAHALNNKATVIAVSRSDTKLAALETDVSDIATGTLVGVVADFASEQPRAATPSTPLSTVDRSIT